MQTFVQSNGSQIKWYGDEFLAASKQEMANKIRLAMHYVRGQAIKNVSISTRTSGPSRPGEFPHADTGRLRNSIFADVDEHRLVGIVGTNLEYALALEYGTRTARTIRAKNGKTLSWIGPDGVRRFAKYVVIPPMPARSFLRRSMHEAKPKLQVLFGARWKEFNIE